MGIQIILQKTDNRGQKTEKLIKGYRVQGTGLKVNGIISLTIYLKPYISYRFVRASSIEHPPIWDFGFRIADLK